MPGLRAVVRQNRCPAGVEFLRDAVRIVIDPVGNLHAMLERRLESGLLQGQDRFLLADAGTPAEAPAAARSTRYGQALVEKEFRLLSAGCALGQSSPHRRHGEGERGPPSEPIASPSG